MKSTAPSSRNRSAKARSWPPILKRKYPSGQVGYQVAAMIRGKRTRRTFPTKNDAEVFAEQLRAEKANHGAEAFSLSAKARAEAGQCMDDLAPHGWTLTQAVEYCLRNVIPYLSAPSISEVVDRMVRDTEAMGRRKRTIDDLKSRLGAFARHFGKRQLETITLDEIKEWLCDPTWTPVTRLNHRKYISMLYNYAIRHEWAKANPISRLPRPSAEDKEPGIFTVDQAQALLTNASEYDLLPYISIGLFTGLRTAELQRLDWSAIRLKDRSIIVGSEIAKKRSRRVVEINDTLAAWITSLVEESGPVVNPSNFPKRLRALAADAGLEEWPRNGLRHSFGSYHLAMHGDAIKTAAQMGHRSPEIVHAHYKALVLKVEAESYWEILPI